MFAKWRRRTALTLSVCACTFPLSAGTITVSSTSLGTTPQYVGFSQGDYATGTNTSAWVDYSGANAFRIWSTPNSYPTEVTGVNVSTQVQFDARKAALRADPTSNTYINWPAFTAKAGSTLQVGSNLLSLDYALGQLSSRGVHVMEQMTRTVNNPVTDWSGKWGQWQAYYAQAFYEAKNYNVSQFQIYNEPDLSTGETPADLLVRLQLASDAIHSAIADVNTLYGKNLTASVAGPTSAGSSATTFNTWGKPLLAGNRTAYDGSTTSYDLFDTYDYHNYTSNISSFASNIAFVKNNVAANNASGNAMPVILSEFNYETSASFANNNDNLRMPAIYSGIGADLIAATSAGVNGLYAFKFSQTPYDSTAQGTIPQPTGLYYLDSDNTDNVTGSTPAAEAYRLYAKGFKGARTRLSTSAGTTSGSFTMVADVDASTGTYYAYAANTAAAANPVTLDLSGWNVQPGQLVTLEEVSTRRMGEVAAILTVPANKQVTFNQPGQSVELVTVQQGTPQHLISVPASASAQVRYNPSVASSKTTASGNVSTFNVARSTSATGDNYASYLQFNLTGQDRSSISRAILQLTGHNAANANVDTIEVYGILKDAWSPTTLTWSTAPDLSGSAPLMTNVGADAFPVGHLSFDATESAAMLDVTSFLQQFGADNILSFALVREQQYAGEADDGSVAQLSNPQLILFSSATPEPTTALALGLASLTLLRRSRPRRARS